MLLRDRRLKRGFWQGVEERRGRGRVDLGASDELSRLGGERSWDITWERTGTADAQAERLPCWTCRMRADVESTSWEDQRPLRRWSRRSMLTRLGRKAEMSENPPNDRGLGDEIENLAASATGAEQDTRPTKHRFAGAPLIRNTRWSS